MSFEKHLFISYAHIDDRPLTGQKKGWISRFHEDLQDRLAMRLGCDAKIWRDERLTGNDVFSDEIVKQLPGTAVLVSVVSPRYVRSDWCLKEVETFCQGAERSGGLTVENKSRVVKIVKTPVNLAELPAVMRSTLGHDFFVYDGPTTPIEIDPAYGADMEPLFHRKMAKLASELAETIEKLEAKSPATGTGCDPAKPVVYLAECGYDRGEERDQIETELRAHGYTVLPDCELPVREEQYRKDVTAMMERAALSVHLIGSDYGMVPYGPSGKSVPVLQNEIAIERSKAGALTRIIWTPPGACSKNQDQQQFLDKLQSDADTQYGADLIIGDIETVKATMHAALRKLEQPKAAKPAAATSAEAAKLAYLICDERDKEAVKPLRRYLASAGYQVRLPLFSDDATVVRQHHQDLLAECELVVHYWGCGDAKWKATVEADLWKLKAYRAERPLPKRCTIVAQPSHPDKDELLEFPEPGTVDGSAALPESALESLLKR